VPTALPAATTNRQALAKVPNFIFMVWIRVKLSGTDESDGVGLGWVGAQQKLCKVLRDNQAGGFNKI
jgi:hypothetical protein